MSVYDAAFEATVSGGSLVNMGHRMIDADYASRRGLCPWTILLPRRRRLRPGLRRAGHPAFPVFRQAVYESRDDLEPTYRELASDPVPALRRIAGTWGTSSASGTPTSPLTAAVRQCTRRVPADRDTFADEYAASWLASASSIRT